MSLPKGGKKSLNLEKDLALTKEDFEAMRTLPPHDPRDLGSYLDFLDELWGSQKKRSKRSFTLSNSACRSQGGHDNQLALLLLSPLDFVVK